METFLRRNFKVKGNIASIYKPNETELTKLIEGIEVQLWHKAPMKKIFLASGFTNTDGDFIIEFEVNSPVDYIVDGKISDVFIDAYYNGEKLPENPLNMLNGLVAYWKLDEFSGTSTIDSTGNSHTGTLLGTALPGWTAGKINNGLTFYGGTDSSGSSYVSVPTSTDFNFGAGDFTFAFWMTSNNTGGSFCPLDMGYPTAEALLLEIQSMSNMFLVVAGVIIYTKTYTITPDAWYHVVIRRIGDQVDMCFNGVSLGAATFAGAVSCPSSVLLLGAYNGGGETLNGIMDEIGIWKGHGLSDTEVNFLYNKGVGRQYPF